MRCTLLLLFTFIFTIGRAQKDVVAMAKVNVSVTDMKGKASKGETILFRSEKTGKTFTGRTDASGKFTLQLGSGDAYLISIKSITDSSKYSRIEIRSLEPGEYFTEPFKVNIQFEAARNFTLDNVHFDFGKATLRPDSYTELQELADYMKYKDDIKIEIAGHTDNVGKDADNLKLSQQRADAIKAWLIKKEIAASRIVAKGYGATQPVADNTTEEGRQLNRRTEVRVL